MLIGVKSGCFTLFHMGHIWAIQECAKQVDHLVILTNEDKYIERKKGCVPIDLESRMYMLKNIKGVDEVSTFEGFNEHWWISEFRARRLKSEFGKSAELIVFHSDELRFQDTRLPMKLFLFPKMRLELQFPTCLI